MAYPYSGNMRVYSKRLSWRQNARRQRHCVWCLCCARQRCPRAGLNAFIGCVGLLLLVELCGVPQSTLLAQENGDTVLAGLETYDKIYLSSLSLRGEVVDPPPFNAKGIPPVRKEMRYSRRGDTYALIKSYKRVDGDLLEILGSADSAGPDVASAISLDSTGRPCLVLETDSAHLLDASRSARSSLTTFFCVGNDGNVVASRKSRQVLYATVDSADLCLPTNVVQWTVGRGFSLYVDKIDEVQDTSNGLIDVAAFGMFDAHTPGKWSLIVDPSRQYTVRSARFVARQASDVLVEIMNDDVRRSRECVYPAHGTCRVADARTAILIHTLVLEADDHDFSEVRYLTAERDSIKSNNTVVIDFRSTPPETRYYGPAPKPKDGAEAERLKQPRSRALDVVVACNVLLLMGGLVWLLYRRFAR